jgi:hypothetical protein
VSKARVCGPSFAGIAGLSPAGGMDVCLLCFVLCVATGRSLVPPHVVCHCVWSGNFNNEATLAPVWAVAPEGGRGEILFSVSNIFC